MSAFARGGKQSVIRAVRFPELLGARGLLAIGVVFCHADIRPLFWLISLMDCFFVLSAFLITLSLLESPAVTIRGKLRRFYVRRVARIFPGYYALLLGIAVLLLLIAVLGSRYKLHVYSLTELLPYVIYAQYVDLIGTTNEYAIWDHGIRFLDHTWSLAIEEQFYLLWGFLFFAAYRPWMKAVVAVLFVIVGVTSRASGLIVSPLIPYRLDGFGYGILLALLYFHVASKAAPEKLRDWSRMGALVMVLAFLIFLQGSGIFAVYYHWIVDGQAIDYFQWTPMSIMSCLASAGLVATLVLGGGSRWSSWLRMRIPMYLGQISYALYLVHYPILDILLYINTRLLPIGRVGNTIVGIGTALLLAHLLTRVLDRAQRRLIEWGDPSPKQALPSDPKPQAA